jgi:3-hydroxyisobutyrate dehydrogenase
MRVAVLGTGIIGFPIARNAAEAGIEVSAWNRTGERAEPLGEHGVRVIEASPEAVRGADILATVLTDADAVQSVVDERLLREAGDAVWVQMSTVGLEGTARCAELAQEADVELVDAPVVGTKQPAEQGELTILASGPEGVRDRCDPFFDAIGKRTLWLGPAGEGTRMKLVNNAWLIGLVESLAETIAFAEKVGVDPRRFLEILEGGPLDNAYAQIKGKAMVERSFETAFPLAHAAKDARLVLEAADEAGASLPLVEAVRAQMERALADGHGGEDMAATIYASVNSR